MSKPTTRKVHRQYSYTARNGCRISKHFATEASANAWFDRVGATDIDFRREIAWNPERRCWEHL